MSLDKPHLVRQLPALEVMLRRARKITNGDNVSLEISPLGAIATPHKDESSINNVMDELEREMMALTTKQRRRVLGQLQNDIVSMEALRDRKVRDVALLKEQIEELEALDAWWAALEPKDFILERNDCSRLHRFIEAACNGRVCNKQGKEELRANCYQCIKTTFVVRHDWAAAFEKAEGLSDMVRLPYDIASFEFRVGGKNIICIAADTTKEEGYKEGDWPLLFHSFIEAGQHWYSCGDAPDNNEFVSFLWKQIRAILIALDAEVATHEVVRASAELNSKRESQGKIPLRDYHVIDLSKRYRVSNPSAGESGVRHRMHFVRGHWRHYEEHKTWIKWHLRGDPSLGFIQKHYAL